MRPLIHPRAALGALLAIVSALVTVGCSDGGGGTTPPTPTIAVALGASTLTLTQGQNNTVTVSVTRGGGYTGAVDLSLEGAPAGVTGTFAPATLANGTASSTLTLSAAMSATPGPHALTVRAHGQGVEDKTATLALTLHEAPRIALTAEPAALSLVQGTSGTVALSLARTNFPGAVELTLEGAPAGVSGSFDPASPTGSATASTLTLAVDASAAPGTTDLVIRARGQGIEEKTATVALTITPRPTISLSVEPASLTLTQGSSGAAVVRVTRTNFTSAIDLSLEGAPAGVSGSFAPASIPGGADAGTLTLTVGSAAAPGTSTLVIRARGQGIEEKTASLALTINPAPAYTLTLDPISITLVQGTGGTVQVQLARTNFSGAVAISVSGMPGGVTASVSPASVTDNSATLAVNAGAGTAPGTYTLTVAGQAQGLADRTAALQLTVTAAPTGSYTLTLDPSTLSVPQGGSGTAQIQLGRNNFTGAVALSVSGAPSGVTSSVSPASASGNSSTLTVNVGAATAPGTYTLTVTGQAQGLANRTATLQLTVTQIGGFSLGVTPTSLTLEQGQSDTATVNLTRTGGFTGAVSLSVAGAPSGLTAILNPSSATGSSARVTVAAAANLAPGSYPLSIRGSAQVAPGQTRQDSVALTVTVTAATPADCPGAGIGTLVNGQTYRCTLSTPGQTHSWTFTATQGDYIVVSMGEVAPASANFWPWVRVIAPSGQLLGNRSADEAAQASVNAPVAGTYTVIVGSRDAYGNTSGTGEYRLTLGKGPGAISTSPGDEGGALTNGATHPGSIYLGDVDVWNFTAAQGEYIVVSMGEVEPTTPDFMPWVRIISPTGQLLGSRSGAAAAQVSVNATVAGTYTVIVGTSDAYGYTAGTGSYRLTLGKGPGTITTSSGDQGGALTNGATYTGTIYLGDVDTWSFTAAQGEYIVVSMGEVAPTSADFMPWVRVISPTGQLLGSRSGAAAAQVSVNATTAGTYTVIVGTSDAYGYTAGTGGYRLTLAKGPSTISTSSGDEGGALTNGLTHPGSIYLGDVDVWTFTATQGDYIVVSMGRVEPTTPDFLPWVRVVSPTGQLVGSRSATGAAQVSVNATVAGTFTVIVGTSDAYGYTAGTGSYRLTLAKGPGTIAASSGDEGGALPNGSTQSGSIYLGDVDVWSFTAAQGSFISVSVGEVEPTTPDFMPWVRLVSPTGQLLGNNSGAAAAQVSVNAPVAGTYTVIVGTRDAYGATAGTGGYRLTLTVGGGGTALLEGNLQPGGDRRVRVAVVDGGAEAHPKSSTGWLPDFQGNR